MEDITLDLAIIRNRLLKGKVDERDEELLSEIWTAAGKRSNEDAYAMIVQSAIANALSDIRTGNLESAAREIDLVHNVPLSGAWSSEAEEYFLRGSIANYLDHATIDRIRKLFARFAIGQKESES